MNASVSRAQFLITHARIVTERVSKGLPAMDTTFPLSGATAVHAYNVGVMRMLLEEMAVELDRSLSDGLQEIAT